MSSLFSRITAFFLRLTSLFRFREPFTNEAPYGDCSTDPNALDWIETGTTLQSCLEHDGVNRCWYTFTPDAVQEDVQAPVVVHLHGAGGCASLPSLSWGTLAEDHGFLVVWPQGLVFPNPQVPLPEPVVRLAGFVSATWNDGTGIFGAEANGVDDVGFLLKLVAALQTDGRVDSTRIYLSGHSNGALMAQRFALQTENLVAGVLAFSGGGQPNDPLWQPGGSYVADEYRPTPILFVHGTADAVVPFSKRWGPLAGAVPSLRGWALINGCADNATITEFSEEGYAHHRYDTCSDGVAVHLLEVQGAGHHPFTRGEEPFLLSTHNVIADCPFRRIPFFSEVDCLLHDLDTTALAWDFVSSFQLSL